MCAAMPHISSLPVYRSSLLMTTFRWSYVLQDRDDEDEYEVDSESIEALKQLGLPITFGGSKYNRTVRRPMPACSPDPVLLPVQPACPRQPFRPSSLLAQARTQPSKPRANTAQRHSDAAAYQREDRSVLAQHICDPPSQEEEPRGQELPMSGAAAQEAVRTLSPAACSTGPACNGNGNGNGMCHAEPDLQPASHSAGACSSAGSAPGVARPEQRAESTGLLPSIPEPCGTHLRFDSDGEEPCRLEDSAVIAQLCFGEDAAGRP